MGISNQRFFSEQNEFFCWIAVHFPGNLIFKFKSTLHLFVNTDVHWRIYSCTESIEDMK